MHGGGGKCIGLELSLHIESNAWGGKCIGLELSLLIKSDRGVNVLS